MSTTNESPALTMLRAIYKASRAPSTRELGYGMGEALTACFHLGLRFEKDDIQRFYDGLSGRHAFGADGAERYYASAAKIGNESACRSFEAFFGRPAFVFDAKRLHVDSGIYWGGRHCTVTSFGGTGDSAVVVVCAYLYKRQPKGGYSKSLERRFRLTAADVRAAEKQRLDAVRHEKLAREAGSALNDWAVGRNNYDEMYFFLRKHTTDQLREVIDWCEENKKVLRAFSAENRETACAAVPTVVREPLETHKREKHRDRARREIEEAARALVGVDKYTPVEIGEDEIDARLAGDSIADILAKGSLVPCGECGGRGRVACGACNHEDVKCPVCEGRCRVPAPKHRPDAKDYENLLKTLGARVEGGEVVTVEEQGDLAPRAHAAEPTPKRTRATLALEASEGMIREAAYLSSPERRAEVQKAMSQRQGDV